jgi:hypothetical protein
MPGYGEVIGLPEALWIWFGTDYRQAAAILNSTPRTEAELGAQRAGLSAGSEPCSCRSGDPAITSAATAKR